MLFLIFPLTNLTNVSSLQKLKTQICNGKKLCTDDDFSTKSINKSQSKESFQLKTWVNKTLKYSNLCLENIKHGPNLLYFNIETQQCNITSLLYFSQINMHSYCLHEYGLFFSFIHFFLSSAGNLTLLFRL